jgi:phosphoribosylformylglycinamidine (FGAM) synthase PurS component
MKIYISGDYLISIVTIQDNSKKKLIERIEKELKSSSKIYTSSFAISNLMKFISDKEKQKQAYQEIDTICEKILPLTENDIYLSISIGNELAIEDCTDLSIAINNQMEIYFTTNSVFEKQKLIRTVCISSKIDEHRDR